MAIELYSKATIDTLLAAKLDDAPIDGNQYARKDGAWSVVTGGGGSYLPLAGGAMDTDAVVTVATSTTDFRMGGDFLALNLTASSGSTGSTFDYNGLNIFDGTTSVNINPTQVLVQDATQSTTLVPATVTVNNGSSFISVAATGITFPDYTIQTTAYTGGSKTVTNPSGYPYTLVAGDANNIVQVYGGTFSAIVVPQDSTYNFPIGTVIIITTSDIYNTISSEYTGSPGYPYINGGTGGSLGSNVVTLVKTDSNTWFYA